MSVVTTDVEIMRARLRFVRRERARARRLVRGLPPKHEAYLSAVCAALATEIEAGGRAHVARVLDDGPTRELAFELVALATAGLAYAGTACTLYEILLLADRSAGFLQEIPEPWRAKIAVRPDITTAIRVTFTLQLHGTTEAYVPSWLPSAVTRDAAAQLDRSCRE